MCVCVCVCVCIYEYHYLSKLIFRKKLDDFRTFLA